MAIINNFNAIWTEYAAALLAKQIDNGVLSDYFKGTIEPPLMTINVDTDDLTAKLEEIYRHIETMEQDNERIKVAITSNTSGTGLISSGGMPVQANYPPAADVKPGPRKSVTMTITKVVNGHTVTVGDRTYVCSGDMELSNIVITALADVKLGG